MAATLHKHITFEIVESPDTQSYYFIGLGNMWGCTTALVVRNVEREFILDVFCFTAETGGFEVAEDRETEMVLPYIVVYSDINPTV